MDMHMHNVLLTHVANKLEGKYGFKSDNKIITIKSTSATIQ